MHLCSMETFKLLILVKNKNSIGCLIKLLVLNGNRHRHRLILQVFLEKAWWKCPRILYYKVKDWMWAIWYLGARLIMERLRSPKESIQVGPQLKMLYNFQEIPIMECHLGWISLIKVTNWTFKKSKIVYLKLLIFPHLYPTSQIKEIHRGKRKLYLMM